MNAILVHISELSSWAATSYLRVDVRRIIRIDVDSGDGVQALFDSYGYVVIKEPEAYVVANLEANWRQRLLPAARALDGSVGVLPLEVVQEFQALTRDAGLRLGSQAERLFVSLKDANLERFWRIYQRAEKIQQDRSAGEAFLKLYKWPDQCLPQFNNKNFISDSHLDALLTRLNVYKAEQSLQKVKQTAEYGLLEFGIRLADSFAAEWRNSNPGYANFRVTREKHLEQKSWESTNFLEYSEIVDSLKVLELDAKEKIGIDPFAAACFFRHRAEFELSGQGGINVKSVRMDAEKLVLIGRPESCWHFLYLFGCAIGLECVSRLRYQLDPKSFLALRVDVIPRLFVSSDADIFDLTKVGASFSTSQVYSHVKLETAIVSTVIVSPDNVTALAIQAPAWQATSQDDKHTLNEQSLQSRRKENDLDDVKDHTDLNPKFNDEVAEQNNELTSDALSKVDNAEPLKIVADSKTPPARGRKRSKL